MCISSSPRCRSTIYLEEIKVFLSSVAYLGYVISKEGIAMGEQKVQCWNDLYHGRCTSCERS
jgi:hypothetical protein